MPREGKTASLSTSLRGALATKQSIPPFARLDGLLRGACHPAALCADRVARNDPEGACHVLRVIARECEASSTPRLLGSSIAVSGILDRPVPSTPRLRRGSRARRSFSEGGKPGEDDQQGQMQSSDTLCREIAGARALSINAHHKPARHRQRMRVIQYSRDAGAGIEKPRRTGYPACAGYDGLLFCRRAEALTKAASRATTSGKRPFENCTPPLPRHREKRRQRHLGT